MTGGLLVVTAHPDDEVLIAGGTLAAGAAAGYPTAVVCLTRGEQGPISDAALASRENLAQVRLAELRAACAELSVEWVKCYRRQDGNLTWSDGPAIVRQLAAILEERRPHAMITFGEDGLYYHPDHIATYRFTLRAARRMADPPAMYRAVLPPGLMPELVAELERRGLPADLWDLDPEDFGSDDHEGSFPLDVRRFVPQKLRALLAHRTQIPSEHALAVLDDELAQRFLGREWFAEVDIGKGNRGWLQEALGGG